MIIIDASDPEFASHLKVTEELLSDLGAADKPKLYVMNKCDAVSDEELLGRLKSNADTEYAAISAKTGAGVDEMITKLEKMLGEGKRRVNFKLPMSAGGIVNDFYNNAVGYQRNRYGGR